MRLKGGPYLRPALGTVNRVLLYMCILYICMYVRLVVFHHHHELSPKGSAIFYRHIETILSENCIENDTLICNAWAL